MSNRHGITLCVASIRRSAHDASTYPHTCKTNQPTNQSTKPIQKAPSKLESTSLVLAVGLDLFFARVAPSKPFDVLSEEFNHVLVRCIYMSTLLSWLRRLCIHMYIYTRRLCYYPTPRWLAACGCPAQIMHRHKSTPPIRSPSCCSPSFAPPGCWGGRRVGSGSGIVGHERDGRDKTIKERRGKGVRRNGSKVTIYTIG